jgi:hypothetical protein
VVFLARVVVLVIVDLDRVFTLDERKRRWADLPFLYSFQVLLVLALRTNVEGARVGY